MKIGKISEAALERSVLRPLSMAGVLAASEAAFGEDCAFLEKRKEDGTEDAGPLVSATVCAALGGTFDRSLKMLLFSVVNNLITSGAEAEEVLLDILLPSGWEEQELKRIVQELARLCGGLEITVAGGHTEVSDAVSRPVVAITGWGRRPAGALLSTSGLRPNQDLVMTGWIGLAGTALLARRMEKELLTRYPFSLVERAQEFEQYVSVREAARAGNHFGVSAMHDVSQGGVFGALWELAQCAGVGLEVDLKKIPVRQETIEICEFFDLNPYQLYGQGGLLLGTDRGEALVSFLGSEGIPAAVIGRTTPGNDRILRNGEDVRFLDRPAQDMLWVLAQRRGGSGAGE